MQGGPAGTKDLLSPALFQNAEKWQATLAHTLDKLRLLFAALIGQRRRDGKFAHWVIRCSAAFRSRLNASDGF
jgi:hypothetical protein